MADEPKQAEIIQKMVNDGGDFLGLSAAPHEPRVVLQATASITREVVVVNTAQTLATETRTATPPTPRVVIPQPATTTVTTVKK